MLAHARPEDIAIVQQYDIPLSDVAQPRPQVVLPGQLAQAFGRVRRGVSRRRRLAYIDSHFPWRRSGFRYAEALALLEARPDTLFFSTYELTDSFPAPVHPLAELPVIAVREGITDVYGIFQRFLEGLCGLRRTGPPHPMEGLDMWDFLVAHDIRVHGGIYAGGGFEATDEGFAAVAELAARLSTTMSYVAQLVERVPGVVDVPAAFLDPARYSYGEDRWSDTEPFVCLFAADASERKGADVAFEAFRQLGPGYVLHVVGPHEHRRDELPADRAVFHGWLDPAGLAALHRRVHAFVSPVKVADVERGVADGFPTQAAVDAMSSGCALVSANPIGDRRVLTPGEHYVECGADVASVVDAVRSLAADVDRARALGRRGSERIRERLDVRVGVAARLRAMGLEPS